MLIHILHLTNFPPSQRRTRVEGGTAYPLTAAIMGFWVFVKSCHDVMNFSPTTSWYVLSFILKIIDIQSRKEEGRSLTLWYLHQLIISRILIGMRPANTFSPPVRTIAPISLFLSRDCKCVFNSFIRGEESAFKAFGRLSSIIATLGRGVLGVMREYVEEKRSCLHPWRIRDCRNGRTNIAANSRTSDDGSRSSEQCFL